MTTFTPNNEAPPRNIMIAVMGATGTGKSTFVKTLTGDENIHIGHGQESQTDQVEVSAYYDPDNNCFVTLIDTPGFDDSREDLTDADILRKIAEFLQYKGGQRLNGLVFMHRISDPRMGGISKRNLRMFKKLCGDGALKNVCIATTNWGRVTKEEGDMREKELREGASFFKPLVDEGAQFVRHDKGMKSALAIVNYFIDKDPTKLQIQDELDAGKTLEETGPGAVLREEIIMLKEKHGEELQALKAELEEAAREKHAELLAELEEERQKMEEQKKKWEDDLENLKIQVQGYQEKYATEMDDLKAKMEADAIQRIAENEARAERERRNREELEALLKQHATEIKASEAGIEADAAAARDALLAAQRREREEREQLRQEQIKLEERARRKKEKHDADIQAWKDEILERELAQAHRTTFSPLAALVAAGLRAWIPPLYRAKSPLFD